ncbi:glycine betaine ABC transporter substrate-binding protein [Flaviflexus equikiangi]|uniref:Glycine betaine ABC transporter substrate-binding protein n=1 Tax=Flaviflexus equikiangi TaxID=2758573 RepID=A0ABS2TDT9_9ACTO|nr:glycine betaine ABC transporter substrate-binding protein [Flaviflexus equikiangi]MBM9432253.1 glycine betaine ABC transporter substrate-binding protein [Flaviflexus equikiangi]
MTRKTRSVAFSAAVALTLLAACGSESEETETTGDAEVTKEIEIGVPAGWDEGVVVSHMAKIALDEQGYDVTLTNADIGVIFTGLASGDIDLLLDVWLPVTHSEYLESYEDDIEDLGTWYSDAKLALAVNNDAPIQSIDELADAADEFNNEIIGIDGGAGLTRITRDEVMPTYGLEGMDFKISSTAAMLAELDGAMKEGRNIVVTLWSPHWAYGAYDIRDLEDPEGAYGDAEDIKSFGRSGFSDDYPEIAAMFSSFEISDEELSAVENYVLNENADRDNAETVAEWLDENPEVRERLTVE